MAGLPRLLKFEQLIPGRGTVDRDTNLYLLPAIRGPTLRGKLDWPGYSPRIGHWYSENPESFGRACGVLFGSYGQKQKKELNVMEQDTAISMGNLAQRGNYLGHVLYLHYLRTFKS